MRFLIISQREGGEKRWKSLNVIVVMRGLGVIMMNFLNVLFVADIMLNQ